MTDKFGFRGFNFLGVPSQQAPLDLMTMQQIFQEQKTDLVIELGTFCGGGALVFAHILKILQKSEALTNADTSEVAPSRARAASRWSRSDASSPAANRRPRPKPPTVLTFDIRGYNSTDACNGPGNAFRHPLWSQYVSEGSIHRRVGVKLEALPAAVAAFARNARSVFIFEDSGHKKITVLTFPSSRDS